MATRGLKRFVDWLWNEFDDARLEVHELIADVGSRL
jgi:hypothetical protein